MSIRVPWVDLATKFERVGIHDKIGEILQSGHFIGGEKVAQLEQSIASWMHRDHAVAVSSGTAALELGLRALDIGPGDEVSVPAVSFVATVGAVLRVGATPVVVDVLERGPWIDPVAAAKAVGPHTRLVIPVHLYGTAAPPLDLGIPIFDDACQAVCPGGPSFGVLTALSFYPTKFLGGVGDGGMILVDDAELAQRLGRMRNHGMDGSGHVVETGGTNARMDAIKAAVLLAQLETMTEELERRRSVANALDGVLGARVVARSGDGPVSVYAFCHPDRDAVAQALQTNGIATAMYYPRMVHDHDGIRDRVRISGDLDHAKRYCATTLSIPCHGGLTGPQVAHMVQTLERIV